MEKVILRVKQAKKRDIGRNIIRFDEKIMEKLKIKTGDVISIFGKKESTGIAWPGYPQDDGLGIVRIESRFQKNTGTIINDNIEIRKVKIETAQNVVLAPVIEEIRINPQFERFLKRKLNNYPITIDDFLYIKIGTRREFPFKVISMTPQGICIIKPETILTIGEKVTEFNFLSNNQLRNLVNFLKKCDYSKEDLLMEIEQELAEDRDWTRNSEIKLIHIIEYLLQENDFHWLISKIASDLYNKYEKTISQGQAEALLKRVLDIKLSSAGRTQLYELRKKIRRYDNFLAHFSDLAKIYDFTFKIVLLGLRTEQASNLLLMSAIPGGEGQKDILGVGFYPKTLQISDKKVNLQLWDISSDNQWRSFIPSYCKAANGAILVYDKSDLESFKLVKELYHELKEANNLKFYPTELGGDSVDMPVILMGLGEGKEVTAEKGQSLANELGTHGYIEIMETDTKNFENVLASLSLGIITNYQNTFKRLPKLKFKFKISVIGDINVGKSSLIRKFTQGSFKKDYIKTIGAQFSNFDTKIGDDNVRSIFWDISGQESFHFLRERFFENSDAAIIVYSLEDNKSGIESFDHLSDWNKEIRRYCGNIPVILVANKVDLVDEKDIDFTKIQELIVRNGFIGSYITSAKTGKGVTRVFNKIIEELYNTYNIYNIF
ncbi:MAG: GTP-binding protein [Candidatus Thorarchaeota archaeon]